MPTLIGCLFGNASGAGEENCFPGCSRGPAGEEKISPLAVGALRSPHNGKQQIYKAVSRTNSCFADFASLTHYKKEKIRASLIYSFFSGAGEENCFPTGVGPRRSLQ